MNNYAASLCKINIAYWFLFHIKKKVSIGCCTFLCCVPERWRTLLPTFSFSKVATLGRLVKWLGTNRMNHHLGRGGIYTSRTEIDIYVLMLQSAGQQQSWNSIRHEQQQRGLIMCYTRSLCSIWIVLPFSLFTFFFFFFFFHPRLPKLSSMKIDGPHHSSLFLTGTQGLLTICCWNRTNIRAPFWIEFLRRPSCSCIFFFFFFAHWNK